MIFKRKQNFKEKKNLVTGYIFWGRICFEQLQDDEFRKEWEDIQPEMDVIRATLGNGFLAGVGEVKLLIC